MANRALTMVTRTSGANRALKEGEVQSEGHPLEHVEIPVLAKGFRRMVRDLEFDISEMALTTYLCAKEHGVAFTALPIFLVRGLHHGAMVTIDPEVRADPTRLHGHRVAINRGYTVTTGVWARGILASEYDVDLDQVTWVPTGDEHVEAYRAPANVTAPNPDGNMAALLTSGEVVAGVGAAPVVAGGQTVVANPREAALASLRRLGLYPINHLVVVRDELLAEQPDLAPRLFDAFVDAKQPYLERLRDEPADDESDADRLHRDVMAATGWDDPLPYGIDANRDMLETLLDHAESQRILSRRPAIEDVFAPSTHRLSG